METRLAAEILCNYYIDYIKIEKNTVKNIEYVISKVENIINDCVYNNPGNTIYVDKKYQQAIEFTLKLLISTNIESLEFFNIIPDMYLFKDGQIHFNGEIYINEKHPESAVKFIPLNDIDLANYANNNPNIEILSVKYYSNNKFSKYKEVYRSNNYCSMFYGKDRKVIYPGDWIVKESSIYKIIDSKTESIEKIYGISKNSPNIKIHPGSLLSEEIKVSAAKWWGQFLLEKTDNRKYNKFIKILASNITKAQLKISPSPYFQLGYSSNNRAPKEVLDSAIEAGVSGFFPSGIEMKIYSSNQFTVVDQKFDINFNSKLYNKNNINFKDSPYMIIKGGKFRIVEIDLNQIKGDLYYTDHNDLQKLLPYNHQQDILNKSNNENKLFLKINIFDFIGGEDRLKRLSDQAIIDIMHDINSIKLNFKAKTSICYINMEELIFIDQFCQNIGETIIKIQENNYAYYTSSILKVKNTAINGVLVKDSLTSILKDDWFILDKNLNLHYCTKEFFQSQDFKGYICDSKGNILHENGFLPGDTIPNMKFTSQIEQQRKSNTAKKSILSRL